ncbi:MAG: hypothetical protein NC092_08345, partial [Butyrivibrio sp.]|nr:hypothetical protein [Butyrivibrio sp.]
RERKDFGRGFYMAVSKSQVIGPTADDDTAFCLKAYWDGLYGKVGSDAAKGILLNNLETENLGIQYYVGKQEVADRLIVSIKAIDWR